jgi:hypothetical protein
MAREERAVSKITTTIEGDAREPRTGDAGPNPGTGSTTTAIHVPTATWMLLRAVAFHRAQASGGRASVSKLITELVELHRSDLEKEIA